MPLPSKFNRLSQVAKISDEVINDNIKGSYAIGILGDGIDIQKVLDEFVIEELQGTEEDGNTYTYYTVQFQGEPVRVYLVGSLDTGINFPFSGKLTGDIPNQEERLVQLMEEDGNYKYKIIKK